MIFVMVVQTWNYANNTPQKTDSYGFNYFLTVKKLNIKHWRDKNWKIIHANNFTVCWQFWNRKKYSGLFFKTEKGWFSFSNTNVETVKGEF